MSKRRGDPWAGYLEHPRFGYEPRVTGSNPQPRGLECWLHWHSPEGVRVPNTAIAADTARQHCATIHVTHYFDAQRKCRKCRRPFLFFAEEQKFWYETLQLPLEANAVRCWECRRDERELQKIRTRYEGLTVRKDLTADELHDLLFSLLTLMEEEIFSRKQCPHAREIINRLEALQGASAKLAASLRRVERIEASPW